MSQQPTSSSDPPESRSSPTRANPPAEPNPPEVPSPPAVSSPPEGRSPSDIQSSKEARSPSTIRSPPEEPNAAVAGPSRDHLPEWQVVKSRSSGATFYYNRRTKKSQWHAPGSQRRTSPGQDCEVTSSVDNLEMNEMIRCSQISIKHHDTQNPLNWRQPGLYRTRRQARKLAIVLRQRFLNGESFEDLANDYSDCTPIHRLGLLGRMRRGEAPKTFEHIASNLRVGQISEIVESIFGYHILLRKEFRSRLSMI